jgi:hypothetical protein
MARTRERLEQETGLILAIQETTSLNDRTHPATTGLGPLPGAKTASQSPQGMLAHSVLAVNNQGVPFGLLHPQVWVRLPEEAETDLTAEQKAAKKKATRQAEAERSREEKRVLAGCAVCKPWSGPDCPASECSCEAIGKTTYPTSSSCHAGQKRSCCVAARTDGCLLPSASGGR